MHTGLLMTLSAALLALFGAGITFLPHELLSHVGVPPVGSVVLLIQLLGALYLGAAILNWMNRGSRVGGIYGRPMCMANFCHFSVGAMALLKAVVAARFDPEVLAVATLYSVFAVWFGIVLFTHPAPSAPSKRESQ